MAETSLYPRLLGPRWGELAERVRRCHEVAPTLRANAVLTVERGAGWLARFGATVMRLPRAAPDVRTSLVVTTEGDHQLWSRSFAGQPVVSTQYEVGAMLAERFGLVEVQLALEVVAGELHYRAARARLCLGPLRIPIPGFLCPKVEGRAYVDDETPPGHMSLLIRISHPLVGLVVSYAGVVRPEEAAS
ncbi:MAG: DUF4166 domain-containing protein [Polyangiaceae bacterium]